MSHSRTGGAQILADALTSGANDGSIQVVERAAVDATLDDVRSANAIAIVTTANFGYMAGLTKDFFERIYLDCLDRTTGLPWALVVKGTTDATGAVASVEKIVKSLHWKLIAKPLVVIGQPSDIDESAADDIGKTFAAGLTTGLF